MHSLAAQLASSGLTQTSIASTLSVTAPPQQPVQAVAAAAHQSNPEQLYQTLCCGEHVKLCCYSMSAGQQWAGDGRQLQLVVRELLGTGGNADVYKVEVVKHAAAAAGTATAAARQQQAEAGADSAAANAAAWWAELDACKAAAAAAAAAAAGAAPMFSTSCSYMPSQLFALKVPKPYQCMSPAVQQRWDPTGYFLNSYRVLQQEQQLLSRTADCGWVLQSHAYGVVSYGPCGIQELPCLLLELADGSVQQRLEECQAAAAAEAAAATGPPCRPVGLPDWELWKIIKQVLAGVDDLAAVNIVWKDVKPSNIVFTRRGTRKSILLCDFGSSVLVGADGLEAAPMPAGTAAFKAPELKYGRRVGPACDVWGLGCLLLALRLGREVNLLPDEEASDAAESWDAAAVLREFEGELSRLELAFVARCLAYDPSRRPSAWDLQEDANSETVPASLPRPRGAGVFNSALVGQILAAATVSAAAAANP
jgi:serine/threonine protein kinase